MEHLKSCRLCLTSMSEKNFQGFENVSKDACILLKLDLDNEQNQVMCNVCSQKLRVVLEFKSTCISTEAAIISYIDSKKPVPIDLREVYMKEKGVSILDEQKICRLCMRLVRDEFTSVYELEMNMFQKYISEMNFSDTKDPVVCKLCSDTLVTYSSFMKNSVDVNERIKISCNENINNSQLVIPHSTSWIKTEGNKQNGEEGIKVKTEQMDFEGTEKKWEQVWIKTEDSEIKNEGIEEQCLPSTYCSVELHETQGVTSKRKEGKSKCLLSTKETSDDVEDPITLNSEPCLCTHENVKEKVGSSLYKCNFCNYKRKLSTDGKPQKNIPEIKWYDCEKCDYKSKWRKSIQVHMLKHKDSSEIIWYECETCNYKTKFKSNLNLHVLKHKDSSEIQWQKCEICDYKSKWKGDMKKHMIVHSDSSEVQCDQCNFKSKRKSLLQLHTLTHRESSTIEWHNCDKCQYKSKWKKCVIRHMLTHKDSSEIRWHECIVCGYKSKRKSYLKEHMLTHRDSSEIQWYECDVCDYKSKWKFPLKQHMMTHRDSSEVRWYECGRCNYKSKWKSSVKKHMLKSNHSSEIQ